jgi:hypothetical protein
VADYTPKFPLGAAGFGLSLGGTVSGGQLLAVSASSTVVAATTALAAKVIGLASRDGLSGDKITVLPLKMVHETVCGTGGVTAGDPLKTDNTGLVTLWVTGTDAANLWIGEALTTAAATATVRWIGR